MGVASFFGRFSLGSRVIQFDGPINHQEEKLPTIPTIDPRKRSALSSPSLDILCLLCAAILKMSDPVEDETPTASLGVWIGLILTAAISFWCQATVTEERFVPALNVLSTEFKIPDDVAGATLMAAGASSPELFSSIVALFITHSALGLGTIVGSEIFNQLIICAGAVFAAKSGKLQLDKAVVIREVFFYALAIVLLYVALQDKRPVDDDTEEHIFISFSEACMLFAGYIVYVLVCANMDKVVACFAGGAGRPGLANQKQGSSYGSVDYVTQTSMRLEQMPFLHEMNNLSDEPAGNFEPVQLYRTTSGGHHSIEKFDKRTSSSGESQPRPNDPSSSSRRQSLGNTLRRMVSLVGSNRDSTYRPFDFLMHTEKPSDEHALHDVEHNSVRITAMVG